MYCLFRGFFFHCGRVLVGVAWSIVSIEIKIVVKYKLTKNVQKAQKHLKKHKQVNRCSEDEKNGKLQLSLIKEQHFKN